MVLSPENQRALERDAVESLRRAGIPPMYHEAKLDACGEKGIAVREWLLNLNGLVDMHRGQTVLLFGPVVPATDLFFTFARALHTARCGVRVVQPLSLAFLLEGKDYEEIERLERVPVLMLNPFQGLGDRPLTTQQQYRVQEFLTDRYHDRKAHVFLSRSEKADWWSEDFVQIITRDPKIVRAA